MKHAAREEALRAKQQEMEKRLAAIEADFKRGRSRDLEDQAQERENDDVLHGLAADARQELVRVRAALNRMQEGTYGLCGHCGTEIDDIRLDTIPEAASCIHCAAEKE